MSKITGIGDSITTAAGASAAANGWFQKLTVALGLTPDMDGVSTFMAMDATSRVYADNLAVGDIATIMLGTNDQAKYDADPIKRAYFISAIRAFIVWLGASCKIASPANGVTFTGSWSTGYAMGIYGANTVGSKATFTFNGDNLIIGTLKQYNNSSTFNIKVDGVLISQYATGGDFRTLVGSAFGSSSIHLNGLGAGSHTCEIEVTSANASNVVYFHWLSTGTPRNKVIVNNIHHAVAYTYGGSSVNVDAYNSDLNTLVTSLQAIGIDVKLVDICSLLTNADMFDNVHPNDSGHSKIFNADLAAINGGVQTLAYTETKIYKGSDGYLYAGELQSLVKIIT